MKDVSRRNMMKAAGLGTLGLGFGVSIFDGIYQYAEGLTTEEAHAQLMKGTVNFMGFAAKEITPNDEFYTTSHSSKVPHADTRTFSLRVEGLVNNPYSLSMNDLDVMMDKAEYVTIQCIGNPVGGAAISNALWEGVSLKTIIEKASPREGIVKTVFYADDGYSDSIPYKLSLSEDVFLAIRMNGEPLPRAHGYPVRVIVPGVYGMKNVKWVSKIELVDFEFKGYWEKQGWSDEAVMPLKSEVLMPMAGNTVPPGNCVIGGVAYGGRDGVSRVQVSLDKGKTWADSEIKPPLSRWAWTLWRYDWKPTGAGLYTITVRAFDRSGKVQESPGLVGRILGSYPDGSLGLHSVDVKVEKP
jgi:DMSO/TMAO reductase YedYZ molybdopterin-dependent catalytic subunit